MESIYEKLGAFYLGGVHDPERGTSTDELLLYDAKDLTTHAVCVGMTGSGKTGLCVTLLEEAAIDGVPAIVIDPKGDLGNLLLTFPTLAPEDFRPWVEADAGSRQGRTADEHAEAVAAQWREGLAHWHQTPARIQRLRDAAEVRLLTPGSDAGIPIGLLRAFRAPPPELRGDGDAMRDRVKASVSGLLALLGIEADPVRSRDHILLSNILDTAWRAGEDLDLAGLITAIQKPPFERVGVFDVESFYPADERFELAMTLNNLLASPGFAAWLEGEPLDIPSLLHAPDGKPRISVLSISHLLDSERMFFVTLLLNEVVAWMRAQSGTSSLRAIVYMDEVFGYLPPSANPPSKLPLLTLLKQARAYGLGVVLATQNPVDLDYKALSNAGTWFIGRLQTERDKLRVLDGLEGASTAAGGAFDRAEMERTLSGLKSRVFLMNDVHEDAPVLFETRWALSYLAGPMSRVQIRALRESAPPLPPAPKPVMPDVAGRQPTSAPAPARSAGRPALPPGIAEYFLVERADAPAGPLLYRPALLGAARLHYAHSRFRVDAWKEVAAVALLGDSVTASPWDEGELFDDADPALVDEPADGGAFAPLCAEACDPKNYTRWAKSLKTHVHRERALELTRCRALRLCSRPGETDGEFRVRLREAAHEARDTAMQKLHKRYAPKIRRLEERIRRAEQRVEKERAQHRDAQVSTAISVGSTLLGALFGRKVASVGNVRRAGSSVRRAARSSREKEDVGRASANVRAVRLELRDLERRFEGETAEVRARFDVDALELDTELLRPRKSDLEVGRVALVWAPFRVDEAGIAHPSADHASA